LFITENCAILPHCLECPKNKVSTFFSCQKCESGYYPVDSTMGTYCVQSCPKGYQLKNAAIGQMCQQQAPTSKLDLKIHIEELYVLR